MRFTLKALRPGRLPARALAALAVLAAALAGPGVRAFPPTPHHTLFGIVRDELGNPLTVTTAEIVLEAESGVKVAVPVVPSLAPGINYQMEIPMDAGITLDRYQPTALRPTLGFRLRVRIGGAEYLPIEMRGDYSQLGEPAGRTRIDLTLGEDSDGDGLPDAWERALIAASEGKLKGLGDLRGADDFDGDGLSNLQEYVAGTYAFDPEDGFAIRLVAADGAAATLDFLAIRGRSYTIQASSDVRTWRTIPFRLASQAAEATPRTVYQPTDVQVVRVIALPEGSESRFFRLLVE